MTGLAITFLILSIVMFSQTMVHIPEVITGLAGAVIIGLSLLSSLRWNKAHPDEGVDLDHPHGGHHAHD